MTEHPDDLAPESVHDEQQDAETQAQSVTDDARTRSISILGLEQSEKLSGSFGPVDAQDLVDHLNQMDTSGTIDMSAYNGEETMDDFEGKYGRAGVADKRFKDDDS